ncbi:TerB family tellurite resistance protein [Rhizobium sp. BK251]|uniref:tellurite resistance TerB family protein n=1 Tax=Rhizobium sp. BK251 TaxID=2512125 RepID=UPI001051343A|nr:TerB family tellurite resistance protein [Rhizobium sp. BK251]TCL72776.1 putative tellurite resistance protein B-like protein [Rhizobium sp. BK251]
MFERFQEFFQNLTADHPKNGFAPDDPRIAVAALCMQVMEADGTIQDSEKKRLRKLLKEQYSLDGRQLDALIAAGQEAESSAVDYFRFTSDLKRHLDNEQRLELIGILWDIVYADGERSEMEDHVIWRIADLLGVSARERIMKRQEAAARLSDRDKEGDDAD